MDARGVADIIRKAEKLKRKGENRGEMELEWNGKKYAYLFRSPVTSTVTPALLSASYLARWSTMAAPNLRCSSLTWSRCVFINTT